MMDIKNQLLCRMALFDPPNPNMIRVKRKENGLSDNTYLKILEFSQLFVSDAAMFFSPKFYFNHTVGTPSTKII